ncbi:hypothetical protein CS542_07845 [Pedobacter sp. IW39]|nr:hypothetical protein CS542_07845 [Pedobacter sp. IW39]
MLKPVYLYQHGIEPIVYTVANETAVTVDNLPAGVNWAQSGNKITISGTPTYQVHFIIKSLQQAIVSVSDSR